MDNYDNLCISLTDPPVLVISAGNQSILFVISLSDYAAL